MERRLVTIFAADAVAYSRLAHEDEEATLASLRACRELIRERIRQHRGRVFGGAGDSMLAEFASPVEAVRSALAVQEELAKRNAGLPEPARMLFRIGLHLGDVVVEGDDLMGDAVNIAARLEGLAAPGAVCLSKPVLDQVANKLDCRFVDLGEQRLKNIAQAVRIWRAYPPGAEPEPAWPAIGLPDRPSISVPPFVNMSGDDAQDYFSDGISEDIITELSRFRSLFVIDRNSSSAYKGRSVSAQEIARDLGVQFVLGGSVRRAGSRVRITAQLVDATTGSQLWAQRYDRDLEDIFAVQDEVTQEIVATLVGRLEAASVEGAKRKPTGSLAAYDYFLRGKDHHHRSSADDNRQAEQMLLKAIELDPGFAQAYAWLACTYGQAFAQTGSLERVERAFEAAQKAYVLDPSDSECHRILTEIYILRRRFDEAEFHQERAITLNPNDARIVAQRGNLLTLLGRAEEGVGWLQEAMRLNPYHPESYWANLALSLYAARRYEEASKALKRITRPQVAHLALMAASLGQLGRREEVGAAGDALAQGRPGFSANRYVDSLAFRDPAEREHVREGLTKAGLPD